MKTTYLVCVACVFVFTGGLCFTQVNAAGEDVDDEGHKAHRCRLPLGMKDRRISDHQITASSSFSSKSAAHRGRLGTRKDEYGYGAWSSKSSTSGWLQIDLGDVSMVTKVATQGRQDADQWVKRFNLEYSIDGIHWAEYRNVESKLKIFSGNSDRDTIATNTLKPHIYARYVKFVVETAHEHASMRVELYGCRNVKSCFIPLGIEDQRIPDTAMSASYFETDTRHPRYARLNNDSAWCAHQKTDQYIQIDLDDVKTITGIATQGFKTGSYWVTTYYLEYSVDGINWAFYYGPNTEKNSLPGNSYRGDTHTNFLEHSVIARFVRIWPQTKVGSHCMRLELYGCKKDECFEPLGVQDGRVQKDEMTASSALSSNPPHHARINSAHNGWVASKHDNEQWLQVDLRMTKKVTAVVTQGEYDDYWVTKYKLSHSIDALHWVTMKENGAEKIYQGNHGYTSLVRHSISPAIYARYVRFRPVTWSKPGIGMRVEVYGCKEQQRCGFPVGMENGRVDPGAITASSVKNAKCSTNHARMNSEGAWCPNQKANQWLQIHLPHFTMITKVATQGNQDADQWVTSYRLSYSMDGKHWDLHRHQEGQIRVFSGNADRNSVVVHTLFNPFQARYVRFLPRTWHHAAAMRAEVYGCQDIRYCKNPLGLVDGRIRDSELDASSSLDVKHGPTFSRLYAPNNHSWCSSSNDTRQWLQIDLRITKTVTKIALQGRGLGWVKSYTLMYSVSESNWVKYEREGRVKVFLGNYDEESVVSQEINPSIHARFIRIQPTSWRGRICLRTELYGCLVEGIGE